VVVIADDLTFDDLAFDDPTFNDPAFNDLIFEVELQSTQARLDGRNARPSTV
jgi:hypothetical protein